jgi:hypothetical protein
MSKREIQLGDVFEIRTPIGRAYLQYVKWHEELGHLVRVLCPVFELRPERFTDIVTLPERFVTFFPLAAAQSRGIVERVATEPVPTHFSEWPTLRSPGKVDPKRRVVESWWLWDGQRSISVDRLTQQQTAFSIKEIINDTALIQRIVTGWVPTDYV